jgi:FAD/FMN-containing dehydrogenase
MTARSPCRVFRARDEADILEAVAAATAQGRSMIGRGAGHSYADPALNTHGAVLDFTGMHRILAWDAERGIMQVEPGVTLRELIRIAFADGWWPPVVPSTAEATIGGCVAMNVTSKNAWNTGSFGDHVLALTVLLPTGGVLALARECEPELFRAFVGSAGLLGFITSISLQLQRITSGLLDVRVRPVSSLSAVFDTFEEEQSADLLEGLLDGFAAGAHLGRGIVTSTSYSAVSDRASLRYPPPRVPAALTLGVVRGATTLCRPLVRSGMRAANSAAYVWSRWWIGDRTRHKPLFQSTFYPLSAFAAYQAALPHGMQSLHAFVPRSCATAVFAEILRRSQVCGFMPLWCVVKRHRPDPFLLSYQVDGFSLETYYQLIPHGIQALHAMLLELMELVVQAGGRFHLAKDALLTPELFRRSMGDATVETFLRLKRRCDPDGLLQSDLYRRVFQAS